MKMSNAKNKKLKFTRTKIVNLEMFYKVSISIIPIFNIYYKIVFECIYI